VGVACGHSASLVQTMYLPAPVQVAAQETSVTRVPPKPPVTVPQQVWPAPHCVELVHATGVSFWPHAARQE
jgi:hypothetical protein